MISHAKRQHDEQIRQVLPVPAVRSVRLGRPVQRFAVGKDVRFGQLVEAVDQQLDDEHEEEDRGHLEEQPEIDAMAVARPERRDERGRRRRPTTAPAMTVADFT